MKKVLILGSGRIGSTIAHNLSKDHQVYIVDKAIAKSHLTQQCEHIHCDITDHVALKQLLKPYDIIVGALPSKLGFSTLKQVIKCSKPIVDISFFAENALELNDLAEKHGVTALVDFGLAPGLSNMYAGHVLDIFDRVKEYKCMVGGLPVQRQLPYQYKAPFAPLDVIEEYTRPARMRQYGNDITQPALSEIETVFFDGIGHLEAFNTDGLRTLLHTTNIPTMAEKTIRYPGHARLMQQLSDGGFFQSEHIENTAKVLLQQWQFQPQEADITVMHISAKGLINNQPIHRIWQLIDHYDDENHISSMARTTGYTCAAGIRLMLNENLPNGVIAPEIIGQNSNWFKQIINELQQNRIYFKPTQTIK